MSEPKAAAGFAASRPTVTHVLLAFVAGFAAVLAFQQSLRAILVAMGAGAATSYSVAPAVVGGVPRLMARAFWGGVWGIVFAVIASRVPRRPASAYWIAALLVGALFPSLFSWFIAAPLKGQALAAGGDPVRICVTLASNAAWGAGTAALYRLLLHIRNRGFPTTWVKEFPA